MRRSLTGRPSAPAINPALLTALTVLLSITPYTTDSFLPALPQAAERLGAPVTTMQLTLTAVLVGVALGQLVFGPLSDRFGRRGPLITGSCIGLAAAVVSALAPTVEWLIVARFVQGLAGAAGMVLSKTIVRDRTSGGDTVYFVALATVGAGVLAIFAPVIGGVLLDRVGWRCVLWLIVAANLVVVMLVLFAVPETHAAEHRDGGPVWSNLTNLVRHLRNRAFLTYVTMQAGSYGALIAYVSASSFVYQNVLGFDSVTYGILFALNASMQVLGNFVANWMFRGVSAKRLVTIGLGLSLLGTACTATAWAAGAPAWLIATSITLSMAPLGLNGPNIIGLALNQVTSATGSAAATLGFVQFCVGSLVAPVVGLWGATTPLPMFVTMAVLAGTSMAVLLLDKRRQPSVEIRTSSQFR